MITTLPNLGAAVGAPLHLDFKVWSAGIWNEPASALSSYGAQPSPGSNESGLPAVARSVSGGRRLEPAVGIEPTTYGLRNRCSATELRWHCRQSALKVSTHFSAAQVN